MKKTIALVLTAIFIITVFQDAYSAIDDRMFTDPVANTYFGRIDAKDLIKNLNFADVTDALPESEAIVRGGALNMIKGFEKNFYPKNYVSNSDAVEFVLRAIGNETLAQQTAVTIQPTLPANSPLRKTWAVGYLNLAMTLGMLTQAEYNDVLAVDQTILDPAVNFIYDAPVTRERFAQWLYQGLRVLNPSAYVTPATQQAIYTFSDWTNIAVDKVNAVEALTMLKIMPGKQDGSFDPKGYLNRAELAQILKNLDTIYYNTVGIAKKTGTVGAFKDNQATSANAASLTRSYYIRTSDGRIDIFQYQLDLTSAANNPQTKELDTVVYKNGKPTNILSLEEGDKIEYLTRTSNNTVLYIQVIDSSFTVLTISAKLKSVDTANGMIVVVDSSGKEYSFSMSKGLYGKDTVMDYIVMSGAKRDVKKLPILSAVELTLKNNVVDSITYIGEPTVVEEYRGIVIENNPDLLYLTMIGNDGKEVTKSYYGDIIVKKQQYYEDSGTSYFYDIFPNFRFQPETMIEEIEPGDIVFYRLDPNDKDIIASISASTNYIMRYGRIVEFTLKDKTVSMLIEYEDKQNTWFEISNQVFISREGRPIKASEVKPGDWAKILINQAIITPGYVVESVKELALEGDAHFISTIIKGQFGGFNTVQNQMSIQNAQTLTKTGWSNHNQVKTLSIAGKDIEYYLDGKRITQSYANQYLKRSSADVYLAMENNYTGEKVKIVSFRTSRDELLNPDTVISADGNGNFGMVGVNGAINADAGTIIRRYGRLVNGSNIMVPDYAVVSLNGGGKAAVVDIFEAPDTSAISVFRGRVLSVDEGKSFKVQSISLLSGSEWNYTPIQREFSVDYNTLYVTTDGIQPIDTFLGYTENSAIDKAYNITANGTKATMIIDAPYSARSIRGTIYSIDAANGTVSLKDAAYYNDTTKKWTSVHTTNATVVVTLPQNAAILKDNSIAAINKLVNGDRLLVMTNTLPATITGGMSVNGYIVKVEK